jgi:hypothetical protein
LLCQLGQVLAGVEADFTAEVLLAAVALVVAAISAVALALRQPSTAVAFEEHQSPGVHTLPAEVLADQVPHLDSIMVVIAYQPCDRRDSVAQSVDLRRPISPDPLQLLGNQTV